MRGFSKLCVVAYIVLITLMLLARDIIGISVSKWLFVVIAGGLMFASELYAVVYMTAFTIPLLCGLPGTYIMLIVFGLLVLKLGRVSARTIILCALLLIMEFTASIWYPYSDIVSMMSYMVHVAVLIILISDDVIRRNDVSPYCIVQIYIMGSVLLCAVILISGFMNAPANWLELYAKGWFRLGETHTDELSGITLTLNANNLGYFGIVGVFAAFHLWRKGYNKLINLSAAILHFSAGVLTLSRSFLLLCAACVVLMILLYPKNIKGIFGAIIGVTAAGAIAMWIMSEYPDILTGWNTRMTNDNVATGNGRVELLLGYLEAWMLQPRCMMLGAGVTGYMGVLGVAGAMHNATEQILVCYGFIGTIVFLYGLITPVVQIRREKKMMFVDWLPYLSLVCFVQTIQFVNPTMLMMPYAIAVHALRIEQR